MAADSAYGVGALLSPEHFSVDGTMIEVKPGLTWAFMKSVRPKNGSGEPPAPGRNGESDLHGERRGNHTHASTTDPQARLSRKGPGREARPCVLGHALMENRSGLVVDACLTRADGHAERIAAPHMIEPRADRPKRVTPGADKGYDTEDFVDELRSFNVTPHVAAKLKGSAIDGRTTCQAGCKVSQIIQPSASRRRSAGSRPPPACAKPDNAVWVASAGRSPSPWPPMT